MTVDIVHVARCVAVARGKGYSEEDDGKGGKGKGKGKKGKGVGKKGKGVGKKGKGKEGKGKSTDQPLHLADMATTWFYEEAEVVADDDSMDVDDDAMGNLQ
jgi:hypothetical protein